MFDGKRQPLLYTGPVVMATDGLIYCLGVSFNSPWILTRFNHNGDVYTVGDIGNKSPLHDILDSV